MGDGGEGGPAVGDVGEGVAVVVDVAAEAGAVSDGDVTGAGEHGDATVLGGRGGG